MLIWGNSVNYVSFNSIYTIGVKSMATKTSQLNVKMLTSDYELLRGVAKARGEDISDFVRRAIKTELAKLSFYSENEKKALGVMPAQGGEINVSTPQ